MGDPFALFLIGAFALLLVSAGVEDVRTREIANWKNAILALLAPAWWWFNGMGVWPDMVVQIGVALLVFAFFFAAFCLGQMGGGDVKLIGALALWLPPQPLLWMLVVMSLLGGALTLLLLADHWFRRTERGQIEVPYGVAIALAGLLTLNEPIFNQFL
ncbi:A24 family peptidase [Sphingomonas xinjiangensis]|uniref:Prepilin peptidase CpaA n=1 Tax=Sphingomonas xinjiangensis TaxID=643568 RepID=A0A840YPT7_9SPHN|nr:prepilin peptidase [Sphingomonas xinjiangensis]MBB5710092.1 prepilin peptidase CpaA [Sphingomonas xinjiangensis]